MGLFGADALSVLGTIAGIILLEVQLFTQGIKSKVPDVDYLTLSPDVCSVFFFYQGVICYVMCCLCVHSSIVGLKSAVEIRLSANCGSIKGDSV